MFLLPSRGIILLLLYSPMVFSFFLQSQAVIQFPLKPNCPTVSFTKFVIILHFPQILLEFWWQSSTVVLLFLQRPLYYYIVLLLLFCFFLATASSYSFCFARTNTFCYSCPVQLIFLLFCQAQLFGAFCRYPSFLILFWRSSDTVLLKYSQSQAVILRLLQSLLSLYPPFHLFLAHLSCHSVILVKPNCWIFVWPTFKSALLPFLPCPTGFQLYTHIKWKICPFGRKHCQIYFLVSLCHPSTVINYDTILQHIETKRNKTKIVYYGFLQQIYILI